VAALLAEEPHQWEQEVQPQLKEVHCILHKIKSIIHQLRLNYHIKSWEKTQFEDANQPLGGVTGLRAFCGSVGTGGITSLFSEAGVTGGAGSAATKQCKGVHLNVDYVQRT
jgi:hypothetical protein